MLVSSGSILDGRQQKRASSRESPTVNVSVRIVYRHAMAALTRRCRGVHLLQHTGVHVKADCSTCKA